MEEAGTNRVWWALSAVAVVLFVWLRFSGLFDQCLWFDEIYSAHAASMPLTEMFPFIARDLVHPPLFYLFLNAWTSIFGDSATSLRAFPFTISLLSIIPAYLLMKQLKVGSMGIAAGLLFFAVNGILIKYSQEVRMYCLVVLLSLTSTFLFQRFFKMGKGVIALTIVNGLLLMTHYFGFVLILSQILAIAGWQRIKVRTVLISGGLTGLALSGWLIYALSFRGEGGGLQENIGWIPAPGVFTLMNTLFDFIEPVYFDMSTADLPTNPLFSIPMLLLVLITLVVALSNGGKNQFVNGEGLFPQLGILVIGIALVLVISLAAPYSVWGTRHLLVLFGPFLAVVTLSLSWPSLGTLRAVPAVVLLTIIILSVSFSFIQPRENRYIWCGWEKFSLFLEERPKIDDRIYFVDDLAAYHFWYFSRTSGNREILLLRNEEMKAIDEAFFLPRGFDGIRKIDSVSKKTPFLIAFTAESWDEESQPLKQLVSSGCAPIVLEIYEASSLKAFLVRCE